MTAQPQIAGKKKGTADLRDAFKLRDPGQDIYPVAGSDSAALWVVPSPAMDLPVAPKAQWRAHCNLADMLDSESCI
jgi:hypothetical protein